jgi:uncharacterized membrane protein
VAPLAATVVAFAIGYVQKLPCYAMGWRPGWRGARFGEFCYSDVPVLFRQRGLIAGVFPYAPQAWKHPLEYPVVIGLLMDATARLTRWLGPAAGPVAASRLYFDVNALVLLGCALVAVWATWSLLRAHARPGAALLVAAAPSLALAGTINWDLVAVAFSATALLAWARGRPAVAGLLIGLGTAAKLYPALLLGPLLWLCLRTRRMRAFCLATGVAGLGWTAVNLPVALRYPDGWMEFWRFNAERQADYGSVWHALLLAGYRIDDINTVSTGAFLVLCAAIGGLALLVPRPPTVAQLTFLTVAAFLVTNKVYSPQYVLWLLPLVVLARAHLPVRRVLPAWALWQAAELAYWLAIWRFFTRLSADDAWQYPAATAARVMATLLLCGLVVADCLRRDPVGDPMLPAGPSIIRPRLPLEVPVGRRHPAEAPAGVPVG